MDHPRQTQRRDLERQRADLRRPRHWLQGLVSLDLLDAACQSVSLDPLQEWEAPAQDLEVREGLGRQATLDRRVDLLDAEDLLVDHVSADPP